MIKHGGGWRLTIPRDDVSVNAKKIYCKSKHLNKHHCYQQRSGELTRESPINLLAYVSFYSSLLFKEEVLDRIFFLYALKIHRSIIILIGKH